MKIKTFTDAFEYVNSKYVFNKENYPRIGRLSGPEAKMFALNHCLLHLLISVKKIGMIVPYEKQMTDRIKYLVDSEGLSSSGVEFRDALLNTFVNILSICNIAGLTKLDCDINSNINLNEANMIDLIPIKQLNKNNPIVPTYVDVVEYLINELVVILEKADRTNNFDVVQISTLAEKVFQGMSYWFDAPWVADLLDQIPSVMKKQVILK